MNKEIQYELNKFVFELESCSEYEKKIVHYNSVLNLSNRIVLYNNDKASSLKKLLLKYFQELEIKNYELLDKRESVELYGKYILPVGQYLIHKEQFRTKMNLWKNVTFGVLVDMVLYWFLTNYFYPIFTAFFFVFGIFKEKKAIKNKKFFSMSW